MSFNVQLTTATSFSYAFGGSLALTGTESEKANDPKNSKIGRTWMGRIHARRSNPGGADTGAARAVEVGSPRSSRCPGPKRSQARRSGCGTVPGPERERGGEAEKLLFIHSWISQERNGMQGTQIKGSEFVRVRT